MEINFQLTHLLIISFFFFQSCTFENDFSNVKEIKLHEINLPIIDSSKLSIISSLKIPYDSKINPDASQIEKIVLHDNLVFLLCETVDGKEVVKINSQNIPETIGGIGRGPGQYNQALDFEIENDKIFILTKGSRILTYELSGSYLGFRNLPIKTVTSFNIFKGGNILYSNAGNPNDPYRLWYLAPPENIEKKYLKYNPEKNSVVFDGVRFHRLPWGNYFFEYLNNVVYKWDSNGIDTTFSFDFGKYNYTNDIYHSEILPTLLELRKRGFYNIVRYFEGPNEKVAYFSLDVEMPRSEPNNISILYDKLKHKLYIFPKGPSYNYGAFTVSRSNEWVFPTTTSINVNNINTEQLLINFIKIDL